MRIKRSKDKVWGTGAMVNFSKAKMMDEETIKRINRNVYLQSRGIYQPVTTDLKDWQKEIMDIN